MKKKRERKHLEDIAFENQLMSDLNDKTIVLNDDKSSNSSMESQKSRRIRKELKIDLKKKLTLVKKKVKVDSKKIRNAPGLGMDTIVEQSEMSFRANV